MLMSFNYLIKPRILPRNLEDWFWSSVVGYIQLSILFLFPAILGVLVAGSMAWFYCSYAAVDATYKMIGIVIGAAIGGALAPLTVYVVFLLFTVWSLRVRDDGLHFARLMGVPKFLPWDQIVDVSPASRRELIVHGWLWPILPAREMTWCLTSIHHYRISWKEGWCYYPPADIAAFEKAIALKFKSPEA